MYKRLKYNILGGLVIQNRKIEEKITSKESYTRPIEYWKLTWIEFKVDYLNILCARNGKLLILQIRIMKKSSCPILLLS